MADTGTIGKTASNESTEELRAQIETLKADLSNLTETVRKEAARGVEGAKEQAAEKIEDLEAQIRRNPVQATAIAAGVGFLLGAILSR